MKIEATKVSKIIEQNFSYIMHDFYEMQIEYLSSLNIHFHDLDASLVAMVLANKLYKNHIKNNTFENKLSFKNFYIKSTDRIEGSSLKIKDISKILNLPRETVRRKRNKLIKEKVIFFDKKKKLYYLNLIKLDKTVLNIQIENIIKFLTKFSSFLYDKKFFSKTMNREEIKKDVDNKFLLYLSIFLDFQIQYFSKVKKIFDIETAFIILLCSLNTTTQLKKETKKTFNSKYIFTKLKNINNSFGLNASTIAEITNIPRTTVLRKIEQILKLGILEKDKFKRYSHCESSKDYMYPVIKHTMDNLGLFFVKYLEIYLKKA